jgi:hypothetical protein
MRMRSVVLIGVMAATIVGSVSCDGKSPTEPAPICSYTISPAASAFPPDGGSGSVAMTTGGTCAWSVTASASWMTLTSGSTGTGPATVAYSVAPNSTTELRSGSLSLGGQTHTVTQQGRSVTVCTYDLSPTGAEFGKDAATGTFSVAASGECAWTATSSAAWLVVAAGQQGTGSGTVSYAVSRNTEVIGRNATITLADKSFTVRQSGDTGVCQYTVAPVQFNPCMPAGSVMASVTTQAGCSWTVTSNVSWLTIPSASSSTGSGTITMVFSDNYDAPREAIAMVRWPTQTAGQNIRVTQGGCLYAVSRNTFTFGASAGSGTFDVIQQSQPNTCGGATQDRCVWTAASDVPWITVTTGMPRAGDNPVTFTVTVNDSAVARVGRIIVRDKIVEITQAGR